MRHAVKPKLKPDYNAAGEIAGITGLPASTVNSYLPYAEGVNRYAKWRMK